LHTAFEYQHLARMRPRGPWARIAPQGLCCAIPGEGRTAWPSFIAVPNNCWRGNASSERCGRLLRQTGAQPADQQPRVRCRSGVQ
jgi:hypothetical protein